MDRGAPAVRRMIADAMACIGFYTRLPVSVTVASFAAAQWAAPLVGAMVGLMAGAALFVAMAVGIPPAIAAAIALAAAMMVTGALHEDGLADVADGFGGGKSREDKLAIMRDSRIGTYGTLALVVSVLARWSALAALGAAGWGIAVVALVAAHAASRALIPPFMMRVPPARTDGLSAGMAPLDGWTAFAALTIGGIVLVLAGPGFALLAAALLAAWFWLLEQLCRRQIGGQTGDVLGTLQQGGEVLVLIAASAMLP